MPGLFDENIPRPESPKAPAPATLKKVRYTHDAVIDEILMNPSVSQGELAKQFGFTQTWMSIVINSDAFQERLAERKGQLQDPAIIASINERLDAIARRSLDKIMDRLDNPVASAQMKTADLVSIAKLGVGDKNTRPAGPQLQQNNLYVVSLPEPAKNASAWLNSAQGNTPRGAVSEAKIITRG